MDGWVSELKKTSDSDSILLQLEFEAVGAGGKDTHIAVDDIFLSSHACENKGKNVTVVSTHGGFFGIRCILLRAVTSQDPSVTWRRACAPGATLKTKTWILWTGS